MTSAMKMPERMTKVTVRIAEGPWRLIAKCSSEAAWSRGRRCRCGGRAGACRNGCVMRGLGVGLAIAAAAAAAAAVSHSATPTVHRVHFVSRRL